MSEFQEPYTTTFKRLNRGKCPFHKAGESFEICEKSDEGRAKLTVCSQNDCFHLKADQRNTFPILANQRCADYMVFIYRPETKTWSLHIFEFTRSVGRDLWESKIIPQFDGAILNAKAVCGVMELPQIDSVTAYCAYRINKDLATPVSQKSMLGKPTAKPWTAGDKVSLPSFPGTSVNKKLIQLDRETGEGDRIELI